MDFARQQRDPKRHVIGFSVVLLLHALVIYGLMTGLARKAVEVIKKPVTATIVEEIKKPPPPPPPPPKKIVEPPKVKAPVQPYVPPPDIPPPAPPVQAPVITAVTPTPPPPEPYVIAPPAPPVVIAPPAPPAPKAPPPNAVAEMVSKVDPVFPRQAIRAGIERGHVVAEVQIDEKGNPVTVKIVSAEPQRWFNQAVIDALMESKYKPYGIKYVGRVEVTFHM